MVSACAIYIVHGRYHTLYSLACSEWVTIVHSHPFKKDSPHSHTTVEFQLIHLLSHVATTGPASFFSLFSLLLICSIPFVASG